MTGWWNMRHTLAVREITALRELYSCHPAQWVLQALRELLDIHTPDRRGRCRLCAPTRRPPWLARHPHCRIVATLLTAHGFPAPCTHLEPPSPAASGPVYPDVRLPPPSDL